MLVIAILAQITSADILIRNDPVHYPVPQAWMELKPNAKGEYMVYDNGRWRWHDLRELGDRD